MVRPVIVIAIASSIGIISLITLAQHRQRPTPQAEGDDNSVVNERQIPNPETEGDYNSAVTKFPDGSEAILLSWFNNIPSGTLNCHSAPGLNQPVIHEFKPNDLLQADAGKNNSQEPIIKDSQSKPWLRVKIVNNQGETPGTCFVRANQQFIEPNSLE
ncbi:SH3 domain-containing protein [Nodularia harveyana UHCC-0300]|uniref:SH3 domain-containing protein n=1 Tax=Nodularia harveyana UHCC-0300 TaxID=2974287 RepID=A0ABU5UC01_9CYAN|nr:SH3 domain-containing protein [Nodularia harveyana]MEA5580650.1 SH3 domain-containing protein [Nodularia harveyana UHCC-0300]